MPKNGFQKFFNEFHILPRRFFQHLTPIAEFTPFNTQYFNEELKRTVINSNFNFEQKIDFKIIFQRLLNKHKLL